VVFVKKSFANLMMHFQRSSKCAHWAQMNNAATFSQKTLLLELLKQIIKTTLFMNQMSMEN